MRVVGLTGGIGCGKSTVTEMLREEHILAIDCDLIAGEVMQKVRQNLSPRHWRCLNRALVMANEGIKDEEMLYNP